MTSRSASKIDCCFIFLSSALAPQEAIYLSGDNGVGKTTLLKILSGLQKPTTGKVNLQQTSLLTRLFKGRSQGGVIYMHQTPYMFDGTVFDNVCYGLKFTISNRQIRRTEAINALRMVGLETLADEHISVLSGGERQRVAMARAWVLKPGVLLMDESSASLIKNLSSVRLYLPKTCLSAVQAWLSPATRKMP